MLLSILQCKGQFPPDEELPSLKCNSAQVRLQTPKVMLKILRSVLCYVAQTRKILPAILPPPHSWRSSM